MTVIQMGYPDSPHFESTMYFSFMTPTREYAIEHKQIIRVEEVIPFIATSLDNQGISEKSNYNK